MSAPPPLVSIEFETIRQALYDTQLPDTDLIIAVGSGGVVFASMIAYKLNAPMTVIWLNYRGMDNQPIRSSPKLSEPFSLPNGVNHILLVDDVVVTGKTLNAAKTFLKDTNITTVALKGHADIVLFPQIKSCVQWPWNPKKPNSTL